MFCIGQVPVTWQSKKQQVVAMSSCKAKYIAVSAAACQGLWLGRLLGSLYDRAPGAITIHVDNQLAIQLCKNLIFHGWTKHIETRFHFIRECVEGGQVSIQNIHNDDQLVDLDILTKSIGWLRLLHLCSKIGVFVNILQQLG
jgi:hypothetical protein